MAEITPTEPMEEDKKTTKKEATPYKNGNDESHFKMDAVTQLIKVVNDLLNDLDPHPPKQPVQKDEQEDDDDSPILWPLHATWIRNEFNKLSNEIKELVETLSKPKIEATDRRAYATSLMSLVFPEGDTKPSVYQRTLKLLEQKLVRVNPDAEDKLEQLQAINSKGEALLSVPLAKMKALIRGLSKGPMTIFVDDTNTVAVNDGSTEALYKYASAPSSQNVLDILSILERYARLILKQPVQRDKEGKETSFVYDNKRQKQQKKEMDNDLAAFIKDHAEDAAVSLISKRELILEETKRPGYWNLGLAQAYEIDLLKGAERDWNEMLSYIVFLNGMVAAGYTQERGYPIGDEIRNQIADLFTHSIVGALKNDSLLSVDAPTSAIPILEAKNDTNGENKDAHLENMIQELKRQLGEYEAKSLKYDKLILALRGNNIDIHPDSENPGFVKKPKADQSSFIYSAPSKNFSHQGTRESQSHKFRPKSKKTTKAEDSEFSDLMKTLESTSIDTTGHQHAKSEGNSLSQALSEMSTNDPSEKELDASLQGLSAMSIKKDEPVNFATQGHRDGNQKMLQSDGNASIPPGRKSLAQGVSNLSLGEPAADGNFNPDLSAMNFSSRIGALIGPKQIKSWAGLVPQIHSWLKKQTNNAMNLSATSWIALKRIERKSQKTLEKTQTIKLPRLPSKVLDQTTFNNTWDKLISDTDHEFKETSREVKKTQSGQKEKINETLKNIWSIDDALKEEFINTTNYAPMDETEDDIEEVADSYKDLYKRIQHYGRQLTDDYIRGLNKYLPLHRSTIVFFKHRIHALSVVIKRINGTESERWLSDIDSAFTYWNSILKSRQEGIMRLLDSVKDIQKTDPEKVLGTALRQAAVSVKYDYNESYDDENMGDLSKRIDEGHLNEEIFEQLKKNINWRVELLKDSSVNVVTNEDQLRSELTRLSAIFSQSIRSAGSQETSSSSLYRQSSQLKYEDREFKDQFPFLYNNESIRKYLIQTTSDEEGHNKHMTTESDDVVPERNVLAIQLKDILEEARNILDTDYEGYAGHLRLLKEQIHNVSSIISTIISDGSFVSDIKKKYYTLKAWFIAILEYLDWKTVSKDSRDSKNIEAYLLFTPGEIYPYEIPAKDGLEEMKNFHKQLEELESYVQRIRSEISSANSTIDSLEADASMSRFEKFAQNERDSLVSLTNTALDIDNQLKAADELVAEMKKEMTEEGHSLPEDVNYKLKIKEQDKGWLSLTKTDSENPIMGEIEYATILINNTQKETVKLLVATHDSLKSSNIQDEIEKTVSSISSLWNTHTDTVLEMEGVAVEAVEGGSSNMDISEDTETANIEKATDKLRSIVSRSINEMIRKSRLSPEVILQEQDRELKARQTQIDSLRNDITELQKQREQQFQGQQNQIKQLQQENQSEVRGLLVDIEMNKYMEKERRMKTQLVKLKPNKRAAAERELLTLQEERDTRVKNLGIMNVDDLINVANNTSSSELKQALQRQDMIIRALLESQRALLHSMDAALIPLEQQYQELTRVQQWQQQQHEWEKAKRLRTQIKIPLDAESEIEPMILSQYSTEVRNQILTQIRITRLKLTSVTTVTDLLLRHTNEKITADKKTYCEIQVDRVKRNLMERLATKLKEYEETNPKRKKIEQIKAGFSTWQKSLVKTDSLAVYFSKRIADTEKLLEETNASYLKARQGAKQTLLNIKKAIEDGLASYKQTLSLKVEKYVNLYSYWRNAAVIYQSGIKATLNAFKEEEIISRSYESLIRDAKSESDYLQDRFNNYLNMELTSILDNLTSAVNHSKPSIVYTDLLQPLLLSNQEEPLQSGTAVPATTVTKPVGPYDLSIRSIEATRLSVLSQKTRDFVSDFISRAIKQTTEVISTGESVAKEYDKHVSKIEQISEGLTKRIEFLKTDALKAQETHDQDLHRYYEALLARLKESVDIYNRELRKGIDQRQKSWNDLHKQAKGSLLLFSKQDTEFRNDSESTAVKYSKLSVDLANKAREAASVQAGASVTTYAKFLVQSSIGAARSAIQASSDDSESQQNSARVEQILISIENKYKTAVAPNPVEGGQDQVEANPKPKTPTQLEVIYQNTFASLVDAVNRRILDGYHAIRYSIRSDGDNNTIQRDVIEYLDNAYEYELNNLKTPIATTNQNPDESMKITRSMINSFTEPEFPLFVLNTDEVRNSVHALIKLSALWHAEVLKLKFDSGIKFKDISSLYVRWSPNQNKYIIPLRIDQLSRVVNIDEDTFRKLLEYSSNNINNSNYDHEKKYYTQEIIERFNSGTLTVLEMRNFIADVLIETSYEPFESKSSEQLTNINLDIVEERRIVNDTLLQSIQNVARYASIYKTKTTHRSTLLVDISTSVRSTVEIARKESTILHQGIDSLHRDLKSNYGERVIRVDTTKLMVEKAIKDLASFAERRLGQIPVLEGESVKSIRLFSDQSVLDYNNATNDLQNIVSALQIYKDEIEKQFKTQTRDLLKKAAEYVSNVDSAISKMEHTTQAILSLSKESQSYAKIYSQIVSDSQRVQAAYDHTISKRDSRIQSIRDRVTSLGAMMKTDYMSRIQNLIMRISKCENDKFSIEALVNSPLYNMDSTNGQIKVAETQNKIILLQETLDQIKGDIMALSTELEKQIQTASLEITSNEENKRIKDELMTEIRQIAQNGSHRSESLSGQLPDSAYYVYSTQRMIRDLLKNFSASDISDPTELPTYNAIKTDMNLEIQQALKRLNEAVVSATTLSTLANDKIAKEILPFGNILSRVLDLESQYGSRLDKIAEKWHTSYVQSLAESSVNAIENISARLAAANEKSVTPHNKKNKSNQLEFSDILDWYDDSTKLVSQAKKLLSKDSVPTGIEIEKYKSSAIVHETKINMELQKSSETKFRQFEREMIQAFDEGIKDINITAARMQEIYKAQSRVSHYAIQMLNQSANSAIETIQLKKNQIQLRTTGKIQEIIVERLQKDLISRTVTIETEIALMRRYDSARVLLNKQIETVEKARGITEEAVGWAQRMKTISEGAVGSLSSIIAEIINIYLVKFNQMQDPYEVTQASSNSKNSIRNKIPELSDLIKNGYEKYLGRGNASISGPIVDKPSGQLLTAFSKINEIMVRSESAKAQYEEFVTHSRIVDASTLDRIELLSQYNSVISTLKSLMEEVRGQSEEFEKSPYGDVSHQKEASSLFDKELGELRRFITQSKNVISGLEIQNTAPDSTKGWAKVARFALTKLELETETYRKQIGAERNRLNNQITAYRQGYQRRIANIKKALMGLEDAEGNLLTRWYDIEKQVASVVASVLKRPEMVLNSLLSPYQLGGSGGNEPPSKRKNNNAQYDNSRINNEEYLRTTKGGSGGNYKNRNDRKSSRLFSKVELAGRAKRVNSFNPENPSDIYKYEAIRQYAIESNMDELPELSRKIASTPSMTWELIYQHNEYENSENTTPENYGSWLMEYVIPEDTKGIMCANVFLTNADLEDALEIWRDWSYDYSPNERLRLAAGYLYRNIELFGSSPINNNDRDKASGRKIPGRYEMVLDNHLTLEEITGVANACRSVIGEHSARPELEALVIKPTTNNNNNAKKTITTTAGLSKDRLRSIASRVALPSSPSATNLSVSVPGGATISNGLASNVIIPPISAYYVPSWNMFVAKQGDGTDDFYHPIKDVYASSSEVEFIKRGLVLEFLNEVFNVPSDTPEKWLSSIRLYNRSRRVIPPNTLLGMLSGIYMNAPMAADAINTENKPASSEEGQGYLMANREYLLTELTDFVHVYTSGVQDRNFLEGVYCGFIGNEFRFSPFWEKGDDIPNLPDIKLKDANCAKLIRTSPLTEKSIVYFVSIKNIQMGEYIIIEG